MVALPPFQSLVGPRLRVKITDIGASFLGEDEKPIYTTLMREGQADIVGFEPSPKWLGYLNEKKGPHETYLPHAAGDGHRHTLHICQAPGMSSLLEPNPAVLKLFHRFPDWAKVVETMEVDTVRLDDVAEAAGSDMIKLDIQGVELMALRHGINHLKTAVLVQTEVEFLPIYKGQALFGDVDQFLRAQGFVFHRFFPLISRAIAPVSVADHPYHGISQLLWADAIFVRDFTRLDLFSDEQLLKTAMLVHECYGSFDLSHLFLMECDRRNGTKLADTYILGIGQFAKAAA